MIKEEIRGHKSGGEAVTKVVHLEWHWNYLWLGLYAIGLGLFLMGMPKYVDDLNFLAPLRPWFAQQGITDPTGGGNLWRYGVPWEMLGEAYRDHWLNDNIRLVNMVGIFILLLPKWIGSIICLVTWMYAIIGGFKLAGISPGRSPLVIAGLLILTYTLPWDDCMGSLVFHMNYLIPTGVNIWLIRRIFVSGREIRGTGRAIATGAVGLLAGLCHEGFAGPTLVGIVAVMVLFRKYRRKDIYMGCVGIIIGILVLSGAPGTRVRVFDVNGFVTGEFVGLVKQFTSWRWSWWICLGAIVLAACRGRLVPLLRKPVFVFSVICTIVALMIALPVALWIRAVWWGNFMVMLVTLMLLKSALPAFAERYNPYTAAAAGVMLTVLYWNQASVGYCAVRIGMQNRVMLEHFEASPDEPFFGEVYLMTDMPWAAGYQPDYRYAFNPHWMAGRYFQYSEEDTYGRFRIVPKELEYVTETRGESVAGGGGVREYEGRYYVAEERLPAGAGAGMMEMDLGKGIVKAPVILNRFVSKGDGKRYVWIIPKLNWWLSHTRRIHAIGELSAVHPRWGM
ncbi:MAG: hypothetical protein K2G67_07660 [Muribaculaceae bacterium]|nr:hypothetical protein [Muribaculaceae bacterium]